MKHRCFIEELRAGLHKAVAYCHANDWAGYDPYDALNSRTLSNGSLLHSRITRIVITQLLKRSPVNLRSILDVPKAQHSKALSLFLAAFSKLAAAGIKDYEHYIPHLANRLEELRSPDRTYWCWGYSFPWQTRTVLVPSGAPNLVCTAFVAGGLLDVYEYSGDRKYLTMARSAAHYIVDKLYWYEGATNAGFAYPLPTVRNQVHNANLLAAALLCRVIGHTGEVQLLEPALRAARFSVSQQNEDGSWPYGEGRSQAFIDNFHTGFNLCALHRIMSELGTDEFKGNVERGFRCYQQHFYLQDGSVQYYHNRKYPIDIHAVAQSIITPAVLSGASAANLELSTRVFHWAMKHMWDRDGYFYYRALRVGTIRTSYMRWSQAWMVVAMAELLSALTKYVLTDDYELSSTAP